jgi:hypothetical protein
MLTFAALNASAVAVALLLAVAARAHRRTSLWLLTALGGYLVTVYAVVLLAGTTGHLTPPGLAVVLAASGGAALWLARGHASATDDRHGRPPFTPAAAGLVLAATLAGAVWAWPHVVGPTQLWVWDDYTYHMVYPTLWLREHAIAAPAPAHAFTMQAWYPLAASVVATWFMAPFEHSRGEALAWVSLTGPLYGGVVAAGAAEILARLGCRAGVWALPVVLFATSPRVATMAGSFSDADLAQAAALFGAFAFAVPRGSSETRRDLVVDTWSAGLLTGFALAVKVSAAPVALIVLGLVALRSSPAGGRRAIGRTAVIFGLAWCGMAGYWYGRNLIHTGNPLYPAAWLWWPGTTFPETTLLEYGRRYGRGRAVTDALAVYLNWPPAHAMLALLGLAGAVGWLAWQRALAGPVRYFAGGVAAITTVVVLLLPGAPYSAGNAMTFRSGFVHWDSMRYVAILPIVGWVALGFLLDAGARALRTRTPAPLAAGEGRGPRRARARILAVSLGALVAGALVAGWHGRKAGATAAALHREPLFGAAARVLDGQPAGTRVAVFGDQWIYPAFGARHHLRPVRLDGDGRPASAPIGDAMAPGDLTVDPATFRVNLRASGVGLVVIVHQPHPGRSGVWPAPHGALEAAGDARLLHRDRAVAVWRLAP